MSDFKYECKIASHPSIDETSKSVPDICETALLYVVNKKKNLKTCTVICGLYKNSAMYFIFLIQSKEQEKLTRFRLALNHLDLHILHFYKKYCECYCLS